MFLGSSKEILYENIKHLCDKENITIYQLEKKLGFAQHTIDKCNKVSLSWERVAIIANYFEVSVDYLIGNCDNPFSHRTLLKPATKILIAVSEKIQLSDKKTNIIVKMMKVLETEDF